MAVPEQRITLDRFALEAKAEYASPGCVYRMPALDRIERRAVMAAVLLCETAHAGHQAHKAQQ